MGNSHTFLTESAIIFASFSLVFAVGAHHTQNLTAGVSPAQKVLVGTAELLLVGLICRETTLLQKAGDLNRLK
jgi:hypothetical protein